MVQWIVELQECKRLSESGQDVWRAQEKNHRKSHSIWTSFFYHESWRQASVKVKIGSKLQFHVVERNSLTSQYHSAFLWFFSFILSARCAILEAFSTAMHSLYSVRDATHTHTHIHCIYTWTNIIELNENISCEKAQIYFKCVYNFSVHIFALDDFLLLLLLTCCRVFIFCASCVLNSCLWREKNVEHLASMLRGIHLDAAFSW